MTTFGNITVYTWSFLSTKTIAQIKNGDFYNPCDSSITTSANITVDSVLVFTNCSFRIDSNVAIIVNPKLNLLSSVNIATYVSSIYKYTYQQTNNIIINALSTTTFNSINTLLKSLIISNKGIINIHEQKNDYLETSINNITNLTSKPFTYLFETINISCSVNAKYSELIYVNKSISIFTASTVSSRFGFSVSSLMTNQSDVYNMPYKFSYRWKFSQLTKITFGVTTHGLIVKGLICAAVITVNTGTTINPGNYQWWSSADIKVATNLSLYPVLTQITSANINNTSITLFNYLLQLRSITTINSSTSILLYSAIQFTGKVEIISNSNMLNLPFEYDEEYNDEMLQIYSYQALLYGLIYKKLMSEISINTDTTVILNVKKVNTGVVIISDLATVFAEAPIHLKSYRKKFSVFIETNRKYSREVAK